ncbi:MAG: hypothetical protein SOY98_03490 [Candidatus Cryptobacteroides sp.]|nr:hypothetical protein [Candidatus Cryptobacteroides sp.]
MDNQEKYFMKNLAAGQLNEPLPRVTGEDFLRRLHEEGRAKSRRYRRLFITGIAAIMSMAAAFTLVCLLPAGYYRNRTSPEILYVRAFNDELASICSDIRKMERDSRLCREMGCSEVISELMKSSEDFAFSMKEDGPEESMYAARLYCERQMESIRGIYRKCMTAYLSDK